MATEQTIVTGKKFSINTRDLLRGLLVAVVSAVLTTIYTTLEAGSMTFNWKAIGLAASTTGVSYLLKNFFTPSEIVIQHATKSEVNAVEAGRATVEVKKMPV